MKAKPCPFCGMEPQVFMRQEGEHPRKWEVVCLGHESPGQPCPANVFVFGETLEKAIERWNRRAE